MRGKVGRKIIFATAVAAGLLTPATATATSSPGVYWPSPVEVGTVITVTIRCGGELPPVAVESPAFSGNLVLSRESYQGSDIVYSGNVKVIDTPGAYPVTSRCAHGIDLGTGEITLTPVRLSTTLTLEPTSVEPGGTIRASHPVRSCGRLVGEAFGPVTSEGLVAPIRHQLDAALNVHFGTGQVIDRPGTYVASMACGTGHVTATFTILEPDPAPRPNPDPKPAPKPQVPVKPVGAPQTGGGGTA